jgi:hypothetical protein
MIHELRNSINSQGGRESNIQKAISIQIKNPSSFLLALASPLPPYGREAYFVGVEYSSPLSDV